MRPKEVATERDRIKEGKRGWSWTLLKFSAWLRRQAWLRSAYSRLPRYWRDSFSSLLASPMRRSVAFVKTSAWDSPVAGNASPDCKPGLDLAHQAQSGGVNIHAYFKGEFGLAESARLYTQALMAVSYPVALRDIAINLPHGMNDTTLAHRLGNETPYDVHLLFVNPDFLHQALDQIGRARLAGNYVIACWFWELENVPEAWLPALELVDELLVSSRFVEDAFRRVTDKPITCVPLPVMDTGCSELQRRDFGLRDDAFIFLLTFDFNSWLERKNPYAVIEAFRLAFPVERQDVQLLVKSSNGHRHPVQFMRLMAYAKMDPRIIVRDEVIERRHVQALQRCADVYVSLHRAEGFGLGLAESMRHGKPVIATAWSGNMDFMSTADSCLVPFRLVALEEGQYLHWQGQRWAEADRAAAAAHMTALADNPELVRQLGKAAQDRVSRQLDINAVGAALAQRMEQIYVARSKPESPRQEAAQ